MPNVVQVPKGYWKENYLLRILSFFIPSCGGVPPPPLIWITGEPALLLFYGSFVLRVVLPCFLHTDIKPKVNSSTYLAMLVLVTVSIIKCVFET